MAYFRRTLQLHGVDNGEIRIACDEQYTLYVNGVRLGSGDDWSHLDVYDVGPYLTNGSNLIAVEAEKSKPGPAGLVMEAQLPRAAWCLLTLLNECVLGSEHASAARLANAWI